MLPAGFWFQVARGGTTTGMAEGTSSETLPVLALDRTLSVLRLEHIRQIDDAERARALGRGQNHQTARQVALHSESGKREHPGGI
jgi:hypothetical protein